jgi:hypothetical protein
MDSLDRNLMRRRDPEKSRRRIRHRSAVNGGRRLSGCRARRNDAAHEEIELGLHIVCWIEDPETVV